MNVSRLISLRSAVIAALFGLGSYTPGAAQQTAGHLERFRGPAIRLKTTPEVLEAAFELSRRTNPGLTHGQFTAANMLARNLRPRHANITTQAILSGLQGGKSIGQTLQGLGLSNSEAKQAKKDADYWAKEANREAKQSSRVERSASS